MSEVEYRDIDGFPGYKIGMDGTVLNENTGRILKTSAQRKHPHQRVGLCGINGRKHFSVYELVWLAFNSTIPEKHIIQYKDGNSKNVSLQNLEFKTKEELQGIKKFSNQKHIWTKDKVDYLIANYKTLSCVQMEKVLKIPNKSIHYKMSCLNLSGRYNKGRKYLVNLDFFKSWSCDMAYVLGFLMADGCVCPKNHGVMIELHEQDIDVLEFIRDNISPYTEIRSRQVVSKFENSKGKEATHISLRVYSMELIKLLEQYNLVPNKTGTESLPDIPEEFKNDYLRGLFDGDGWICGGKREEKKKPSFGICSASRHFMEEVNEKLLFGKGKILQSKEIFRVIVENKPVLKEIRDRFYNNNHFSMKRKRYKFLNVDLVIHQSGRVKGKYYGK